MVSVVVPTWQRALGLDRCLSGVLAQGLAPDEVIVVGRPEDRDARNVTERHAATAAFPVRWVDVLRPGYVAPVRRGIAAARHELVAILDDDTEPEPGWLAALLEPFADDNVACVGGRLVLPRPAASLQRRLPRDPGCVRWYGKYVGHLGAEDTERVVDVHGVMEGNWAWRADVLRCLEFDELFDTADALHYGLDLCLQARSLGYRVIYAPCARVVHHCAARPEGSLGRDDRPARAYVHGRNLTRIWIKRYRGIRRAAFPLWWWLVGERQSYGVATAVWDLVMHRPATWPLFLEAMRGRWDALRDATGPGSITGRLQHPESPRARVVAVWPTAAGDLALFRELSRDQRLDLHVVFSYEDRSGRGAPSNDAFPSTMATARVLMRNLQRGTALVWNPRFAGLLESLQPDMLLIGGYGHLAGLRAIRWANRAGIPWVLCSESWVRGGWLRWTLKRTLLRGVLGRAAGFVALGDRGLSYLQALGARAPIVRIHSNRDLVQIAAAVDRHRARAHSDGVITFLFVGRLVKTKGFDVLLDAFARVASQCSACRLAVAGDGPLRQLLNAYASRQGGVVLHGEVAFSRLPEVLAEADVLVLPSRWEPWGQVVPEGMAAGLPVIASDAVGSVPSFVHAGETGWIVPAGDAVRLADAMAAAVLAPLAEMGARARAIAVQSDVRRVAADIADFLTRLRGDATEIPAPADPATWASRSGV